MSNKPSAHPAQQQGMTLVELMVALAIGLFLSAAVAGLYLSARSVLRHHQAQERMQSDARHAFSIMGHAVRNAGFTGCSHALTGLPLVTNTTSPYWNLLDPIGITRGNAKVHLEMNLSVAVAAGSDILRTVGVSEDNRAKQFNLNHVFVSSDCFNTKVERLSGEMFSWDCQKISGFKPLSEIVDCPRNTKADAIVAVVANDLFFIGSLEPDQMLPAPHAPGLVHCSSHLIEPMPLNRSSNLRCRMLAEGAVDLKIEAIHGPPSAAVQQREPGNDEFWQAPTGAAAEPAPIRGVEVRLLMASPGNQGALLPAPQTYTFYRDGNGAPASATAGDRRLYREFSAAFTLRNRVE